MLPVLTLTPGTGQPNRKQAVLRIRVVFPDPGSRISDPTTAPKEEGEIFFGLNINITKL